VIGKESHKSKQIVGIASEGTEIDKDDPVEDWLQRTAGIPLEVMLAKTVQVILDWHGTESHFVVNESVNEKDFRKAVRKHLSLAPKTRLTVIPLGLDSWSARAGFTYSVMEKREMELTLHDTARKVHKMKIAGDKSLNDLCELLRTKWNLAPWTRITVERLDKKPFWVEDKGEYSVATQYDPDLDPRPVVQIRVDLLDRTFIVENYLVTANDPAAVLGFLFHTP
jgi:hypothetical protein